MHIKTCAALLLSLPCGTTAILIIGDQRLLKITNPVVITGRLILCLREIPHDQFLDLLDDDLGQNDLLMQLLACPFDGTPRMPN